MPVDAGLPRALALVAAGGAVGALARWAIDLALPWSGGIPWGTLLVNLLGCLAIGLVAARVAAAAWWVHPLVVTGVLGGFTTMSALALEAAVLTRDGDGVTAAVVLVASIAGGLLAASLGARIAGGRA